MRPLRGPLHPLRRPLRRRPVPYAPSSGHSDCPRPLRPLFAPSAALFAAHSAPSAAHSAPSAALVVRVVCARAVHVPSHVSFAYAMFTPCTRCPYHVRAVRAVCVRYAPSAPSPRPQPPSPRRPPSAALFWPFALSPRPPPPSLRPPRAACALHAQHAPSSRRSSSVRAIRPGTAAAPTRPSRALRSRPRTRSAVFEPRPAINALGRALSTPRRGLAPGHAVSCPAPHTTLPCCATPHCRGPMATISTPAPPSHASHGRLVADAPAQPSHAPSTPSQPPTITCRAPSTPPHATRAARVVFCV
ncbi:hypothetical protein DENSPDRAFT_886620 [Dentipellis sp. KUC8613]|nr:hypothetical protein DENSPDRAFT_886620 [Dentipellis sp. KUC8613]